MSERRRVTTGAFCWILPLFVGLSAASHAEDRYQGRTPEEWLAHMQRAFAELSYEGTFSYFDGSDLASLHVVHTVKDGVQQERLVHLNGAYREFVRIGDEVSCILQPGDRLLEFESSIPTGPFARAFDSEIAAITEHYAVSLNDVDRVANREAIRLVIAPQDGERYGHRLWLDTATGLLLRSELVDKNGNKLEVFQFAQLEVGNVDAAALQPEVPQGTVTQHWSLATGQAVQEAAQKEDDMAWRATWVPDGFRMAAWDVRFAPSGVKPVNTLMYSDGLAAFSVFVEDMPKSGAGDLISRSGATVAVTSVVPGSRGNHFLVTVVGEVPTDTARRVARSVRYEDEQ